MLSTPAWAAQTLGSALLLAVDDVGTALARVAEDVLHLVHHKGEQHIGQALAEDLDVVNRGFLAVQNLADFPGDLAADVLQEQAVDVLDLLDGIELVEEVGLYSRTYMSRFSMCRAIKSSQNRESMRKFSISSWT